MLLKGVLPVALAGAGAVVAVLAVLGPADPNPAAASRGDSDIQTLSKAPISLGNPLTAATLQTRRLDLPEDPAAIATPPTFVHKVETENGDTLAGILMNEGVGADDAHQAIAALAKVYNPKRIRPGNEIEIAFQIDGPDTLPPGRFAGFAVQPDFSRRIEVVRDDTDRFAATEIAAALTRKLARAEGTISHSLYVDGRKADVPNPVLVELIRAYSWDVDFQRDIQQGDKFEIMYEHVLDESGRVVHSGNIAYAALMLSGQRHAIYRHKTGDGDVDYYNDKGQSAKKALLRTPIDGARLSSGFGMRHHPILGFSKMHRGVDFAAPKGTPIYAAGDGTVVYAGYKGAYGKYVQLRHTNNYTTAYAHMSAIGRGVASGKRVRQGQVIGYVGTTGRSTGPHLHYEILVEGRQTNPMKVKMPSGRKLAGQELLTFAETRAEADKRFADLGRNPSVAAKTAAD